MRIRRFCFVLALLLFPTGAWADRHYLEASASISRAGGSSLWGGNLALAATVPLKFLKKEDERRFSLFGDFSKNAGAHDGAPMTRTSWLGGGRYVFFRTENKIRAGIKDPSYHFRLQFFLHLLAGHVDVKEEGGRAAFGGGGGFDKLFSDYGGVRFQYDYVNPTGSAKGFSRFSLGVIYRFEHEEPCPKCPEPPKRP